MSGLLSTYLGGFGVTLMMQPSMYFSGGALPYWTVGCDDACDIQNRLFGSQLCSVDTVQLHDRFGGNMWRGFVGLREFVPYKKVKSDK